MDIRFISLILFAVFFTRPIFAVQQELFTDINVPMMNFTPESGLSQVTVNAITQDKTGFMWFGTQTGLNRFDGYDFIQYRAQPASKNHLAGNFITALRSCKNNQLWVGTSSGLSLYDQQTGLFSSFLKRFNDAIPADYVKSIACSKNYIFVGTQANGVYRINLDNDDVTALGGTEHLMVLDIKLSLNYIFVASEQGLFAINKQSLAVKQHTNKALNSIVILEDFIALGRDDAWLEYYKINDSGLDIQWRYSLAQSDTNTIKVLTKHNNMVYAGTNFGITVFDSNGHILNTYQHDDLIPDSLADDIVLSLFIDKKFNLWIGTNSGGVNYFSKELRKFGHVNQQNYKESPMVHVDMRAFSSDEKNRLWFATTKGAYVFIDEQFIKAEILYEELKSLESAFITNFLMQKNIIWFTTRFNGIANFNINTRKINQYSTKFNNSPAISFNDIVVFQKNIIVSSRGHGLLRFDEQTNKFERFLAENQNFPKDITDLLVKNNALWFGSVESGLFKYSEDGLEQLNTSDGLLSNIVFSLALDDKGQIWSTSDVGINILNDDLTIVETLNQTKGLINESVWSIVFDDIDSMWVGTSAGLARINVNTLDIDNYTTLEGAQGAEFNFGAAWKSEEGRIFLGGTNGFNQFLPREIVEIENTPNLLLNSIAILGEVITPQNSPDIIQYQSQLVKEITLNYDQDIMTFNYVVLAFSNHQKISYFYRIIGLSDEWVSMDGNSRQLNLIKPPPGKYQIEAYAIINMVINLIYIN